MDEPTLPPDLTRLGWKLIIRAPDRMFAVSVSWGGTGTKTNIEDVINEARGMVRYIAWRNARRARGEE